MNKTQRKQLSVILTVLEGVKADLEMMSEEEQEKFDNLTEGLQASEKGQAMEDAARELQSAADSIDEVTSSIETAME